MIETESIIITASESPVQTFPINAPFSSYLADNKDISKELLTCIFARVYPKLGKWQFRSTFYVRGGINCHSLKRLQCQKRNQPGEGSFFAELTVGGLWRLGLARIQL
jgi:hypothetical protein